VLATAAFQAVNMIGYPEAQIILSQCATYLACSTKSNSSVAAIGKALQTVSQTGDLPVPLSVRNAQTKLMKEMGYGKDYQYAHAYEGNFINMEFLPDAIKGQVLYEPGANPREEEMRTFLRKLWKEKYGY
jgi:putative ATPase